jgi:prepilin signal peptidase PulO-like enzyme (type II secretory pathway)
MYPILEFTMGLFFVITAVMTPPLHPFVLGYHLLITFIFVLLSFYDFLFQEVPDEISLPMIIATGVAGYFGHLYSTSDLLIGFAVPVLFFGALFLGSRGKWLGGGDVRIGAIMGFILGWPNIITGLFLGYLLGSVYSAVGLLTGRLTRKSPIPFGPFLFLGTYIALFWGKDIISWYMGMM